MWPHDCGAQPYNFIAHAPRSSGLAIYQKLTGALRKRFTPVQIQSVQSSRFHERKQGAKESVDDYAQDLQKLFQKAYAGTTHLRGGAEEMGQSVFRYQFVAGLRTNLKSKVVGCTGPFAELLGKARFEEARIREMVHRTGENNGAEEVR